MLSRKRPLRGFKKGKQQSVLTLAQRHRRRIGIDKRSAAAVEHPAIEPVPASLRIAGTRRTSDLLPAQNGADACEQFSETERFDDVIVRAEFETDDAIDFVGAMTGGDDNRNIRVRPDLSQEIQPVILTKPQIQNYQTWMRRFKMTIKLHSVRHRRCRHMMIFQISGDHLP